jgi:putative endonuclease
MFYIYILYSQLFDKYYVGHTDDPVRRLNEHNEVAENSYTSRYRPWVLLACYKVGEGRGLAMKIEKHIKKQKSKKYIIELAKRDNIDDLVDRFSGN